MIAADLRLLLSLDRRRLRGFARHPAAGAVAGLALPLALAVALLASIGRAGAASLTSSDGAVLLAMLVAGPISYLAYGTLFRGGDSPLLRRLGLEARAVYGERVARHLGQALGVAALALVPYAAGGGPVGAALPVTLGSALAAWGAGSAATAAAARSMARHTRGAGWGCLMAGIQDRDLADAAPLAYAPLPAFLAGTVAGTAAYASSGWLVPIAGLAFAAAALGARPYALAIPLFGPQALEMAFVPAPRTEGARLPIGRGAARLLPRRVGVVWARDAAVASRRFPWAARVAWPIAIGGFLVLARWGDSPATRGWVVAGTLLALLVQALASIGLGRAESHGRRWIDRSAGIGWASRLAGRWAWGWGLSLWMTVPVALAWTWWSGAGPGWGFLLAGGAVAGVAAAASSLAAGWR